MTGHDRLYLPRFQITAGGRTWLISAWNAGAAVARWHEVGAVMRDGEAVPHGETRCHCVAVRG